MKTITININLDVTGKENEILNFQRNFNKIMGNLKTKGKISIKKVV